MELTNNTAKKSGGSIDIKIVNKDKKILFNQVSFMNNSVNGGEGGALYIDVSFNTIIANSTFVKNWAGLGGSIFISNSKGSF